MGHHPGAARISDALRESRPILTACGSDKGATGPGARGMDRPVPVTTEVVPAFYSLLAPFTHSPEALKHELETLEASTPEVSPHD